MPVDASTPAGTAWGQAKGSCLPLRGTASALVVKDGHTTAATTGVAAIVTSATTVQAHCASAHRREGPAAAAPTRDRQGAPLSSTGPGAAETEELAGAVRATSAARAAGHSDSQIAHGGVAGATGAADALARDLPIP